MPTLKGWPFLITRNQKYDYRTVIAPDFMVDASAEALLLNYAKGEQTAVPEQKTIQTRQFGELTVIYHIIPATFQGEDCIDGFGREIDRIEGVVLRGHTKRRINPAILEQVHGAVENDFQQFWQSKAPPPTRSSQVMPIHENGAVAHAPEQAPVVQVAQETLAQPYPSYYQWLPVATLALLLVVIALLLVIRTQQAQLNELQNLINATPNSLPLPPP